jgi:hypothetical protein
LEYVEVFHGIGPPGGLVSCPVPLASLPVMLRSLVVLRSPAVLVLALRSPVLVLRSPVASLPRPVCSPGRDPSEAPQPPSVWFFGCSLKVNLPLTDGSAPVALPGACAAFAGASAGWSTAPAIAGSGKGSRKMSTAGKKILRRIALATRFRVNDFDGRCGSPGLSMATGLVTVFGAFSGSQCGSPFCGLPLTSNRVGSSYVPMPYRSSLAGPCGSLFW